MSSEQQKRNRGRLFENKEKRKPSQPDLRGECTLEGANYDMQAWHREEQLSISLAPSRQGQNKYPPDAFRGALDPTPKAIAKAAKKDGDEAPVWIGDIAGDEAGYAVRAFQKEGKSGPYLTLFFEAAEA